MIKNLNKMELGKLADVINNVNKIFKKAKLTETASYKVIREYQVTVESETGLPFDVTYYETEILIPQSEVLVMKGYNYLGTITEDASGATTLFTNTEKSIMHLAKERRCDHCHTNHFRKIVHIFEKDGIEVVIGSKCSKDFFGYDIEKFINSIYKVSDIMTVYDDECMGSRGYYQNMFGEILNIALYVLLNDGGYKKDFGDGNSTKEHINAILYLFTETKLTDKELEERRIISAKIKATVEAHKDLLIEVTDYWHTLQPSTDFEYNVKSKMEVMSDSSPALIACAIWTILKKKIELVQEKAVVKDEFFGEIGKRYKAVDLKLMKYFTYESGYGTGTCYIFNTTEGVLVKWMTNTSYNWEIGEDIKADFTVKKHDTWKEKKQTMIGRLKTI